MDAHHREHPRGRGRGHVAFVLIAAVVGVFPWIAAADLMLTNYVFKVAIEAVMTPVTYRIVRALKRVENEDFYDRGTDFNPFARARGRGAPGLKGFREISKWLQLF